MLTEAELDDLLGKPGPPIAVDAEELAACVRQQRVERDFYWWNGVSLIVMTDAGVYEAAER